jgi:MYXO-CTERM domain-containing protein
MFHAKMGTGTWLSSVAAVLCVVCYTHDASASECYDHYNAHAWGGEGLALVFCRNNSDISKDSYITDCELREHNGPTLQSLTRHGSLDNDRLVYTDYNTTGDAFNFDIDIVCIDQGGATHTFFLGNGSQDHTGCCRNLFCGSVSCCGNDCSSGTGGTGGAGGSIPDVDAGSPGGAAACPALPSNEFGEPQKLLNEDLGSTVRLSLSIPNVPGPAELSYAALSMRLYDADHAGQEGAVYVNGQGPLSLPADPAWNDQDADVELGVPVSYLQAGTNLIEYGVGTLDQTYYGVSRVALQVYGAACEPAPDAGASGTGGTAGAAGAASEAGVAGQSGMAGDGGAGGSGGSSGSGGDGGSSGSATRDGGAAPAYVASDASDGCACSAAGRGSQAPLGLLGLIALIAVTTRRKGPPTNHLV